MSMGIYKITNPKGKIYIGKSKNIENRFKSYKKLQHCSQQRKLYNSLKKYGFENHLFEIIEECSLEKLNKKEIYWIQHFNSTKQGLNLTLGGDGGKRNLESETLRRISSMKPIIKYDLQGNFIKEYIGAPEAVKDIGKGNPNNINDCARGVYKSAYGFQWRYKELMFESDFNKITPCNKNITGAKWTKERREKTKKSRNGEKRSIEYAEKISKLKQKPVYQYDINNNLINTFPSFNIFNNSKIIGTTKLRKIINKNIYYKGYKYTNIKNL
jgi:group I intron endonuclease